MRDPAAMTDDPGQVRNARRDKRVRDADRWTYDRRIEALCMCRLWRKSTAPDAAEQLAFWRGVLREVDRQAAMLADGAD